MDLLIVTRPTVHLAMRRLTHTMMIGELDHLLQDKKHFPNTTPMSRLHHDPPSALRRLHQPRVPTPSSEAPQERRLSMWFSLPPWRRMELSMEMSAPMFLIHPYMMRYTTSHVRVRHTHPT